MLDRSEMLARLKKHVRIDPRRTAVVAIDLHRGHLDPEVGTMPLEQNEALRVLDGTARLFTLARNLSIPVIHIVVQSRNIPGVGREGLLNPFTRAINEVGESLSVSKPSNVLQHNVVGSAQTEIMPQVAPGPNDYVINYKRRMSVFYGTDLDLLLRELAVDTILFAGVNTNTCVHGAVFEANTRDFKCVVVSNCVASMYGEDLHRYALQNIGRCMGWVLSLDELSAKLAESPEPR